MSLEEHEEVYGPASNAKPTPEREAVPVLVGVAAMTAVRWTIYYASTPTGQRYIGITSNFANRVSAHSAAGVLRNIQQTGFGQMTYFQAKAIEQRLIELGGGPGPAGKMANAINSIAPANPAYRFAMRVADGMLHQLRVCGAQGPPGIVW